MNDVPTVEVSKPSDQKDNEFTPLLSQNGSAGGLHPRTPSAPDEDNQKTLSHDEFTTAPSRRRQSMMPRTLTRTLSRYVAGKKSHCDHDGPCMGYSDPCGQDCFKVVQRRGSALPPRGSSSRVPTWRSLSNGFYFAQPVPEDDETDSATTNRLHEGGRSRTVSDAERPMPSTRSRSATHHYHHPEHDHPHSSKKLRRGSEHSQAPSSGAEHHHHVPTNAFMSIGLQTSLAIALHKAPEGFITYATNHANPTLGFAVFMALFIHNITEGFAMSLPLYLALNSRFKAILWSSLLGGASQPLGAGIAALWFKVAKNHGSGAPSEGVYGGMFAVTAGVMASVALSLFAESLQLSHNKGTCVAFAFLGMAILGVSFALTAK